MKPGLVLGSLLLLVGTNVGFAQPAGPDASFLGDSGAANVGAAGTPQQPSIPPALPSPDQTAPSMSVLAMPSDCPDHPAPLISGRRGWFDADYLVWWLKGMPNNNILVTAGSAGDPVPGALGSNGPNSVIVFGGEHLNENAVSGARFSAGFWIDRDQTFALEGRGFFLASVSSSNVATANQTGNPLLAIPFHDVNLAAFGPLGGESAALVSSNLVRTGGVDLAAHENLWGAEGNVVYTLCPGFAFNIRLLAGYRHLDLEEDLTLQQGLFPINSGLSNSLMFNGTAVQPPGSIGIIDSFHTHNQFNGGQLGFQTNLVRGRCFAQLTGRVALGATQEDVSIAGASSLFQPGQATVTVPGGLFTQRSNIGNFSNSRFAVVPEGELRVGYRFNRFLNASIGYTFLYWSSVVRPGDQVERTINSSQVPTLSRGPLNGPTAPAPLLQTTDFWAQGLSFSLGLTY
jgi:hypothetical protein